MGARRTQHNLRPHQEEYPYSYFTDTSVLAQGPSAVSELFNNQYPHNQLCSAGYDNSYHNLQIASRPALRSHLNVSWARVRLVTIVCNHLIFANYKKAY
jgi:hypothetical protein